MCEFPCFYIFMERRVRYPTTPLMCFGQCLHIILPAISIVKGTNKSQIKMNHQNHINTTSETWIYHIAGSQSFGVSLSPASTIEKNVSSRLTWTSSFYKTNWHFFILLRTKRYAPLNIFLKRFKVQGRICRMQLIMFRHYERTTTDDAIVLWSWLKACLLS